MFEFKKSSTILSISFPVISLIDREITRKVMHDWLSIDVIASMAATLRSEMFVKKIGQKNSIWHISNQIFKATTYNWVNPEIQVKNNYSFAPSGFYVTKPALTIQKKTTMKSVANSRTILLRDCQRFIQPSFVFTKVSRQWCAICPIYVSPTARLYVYMFLYNTSMYCTYCNILDFIKPNRRYDG